MNFELYSIQPLDKKPAKKMQKLQEQEIKSISSKIIQKTLSDVSNKHQSLLNLAASERNIDVITAILKNGTSLESIQSAIQLTINFNNLEIFKKLYAHLDENEHQFIATYSPVPVEWGINK